VLLALQAPQGLQVSLVPLDSLVPLARLVLMVPLVPLALRVLLALWAPQDPRVLKK
jgi:hypothetical protein